MARVPIKSKQPFVAPGVYAVVPGGTAVPLTGLSPEEIVAGVERAIPLCGKRPAPASLRDAVVKYLGLGEDYREYQAAGKDRLAAFLTRHRLTARSDLLTPRRGFARWQLRSRRSIADRLFCSQRPMPRQLFTGYDFDWEQVSHWPRSVRQGFSQTYVAAGLGGEALRRFFEENWLHFDVALNLLSDVLLDPQSSQGVTTRLYHPLTNTVESRQRDLRMAHAGAMRFRALIDESQRGWVRVLPYSPGVVFLRGVGGEYELLFRDLRDHAPPEPVQIQHARSEDLPQAVREDQAFQRWFYFQPALWEDLEEHAAEHAYYEKGGMVGTYPHFPGVLRLYLEQTGRYLRPETARHAEGLPGFIRQRLRDGRELYVSQLVTVAEFQQFLTTSGYLGRRYEEPVETDLSVGNEDGPGMPAAATWLDAMAYAAWLERESGRPLRLLRIEEFQELAPHPPTDLQGWQSGLEEQSFRFTDSLAWITSRGLRFVLASNIGEWLYEHIVSQAAAVCVRNGLSIHGYCPVHVDYSSMSTWGRYKGTKILFRLCYQATPASDSEATR